MKELSTGWKVFRVACILQMIAVGFMLIYHAGLLFYKFSSFYLWFAVALYAAIFAFLYQALSLLNYNYPDTPLSPNQKRSFNWLYFINFLAIAFLFADVVREWRSTVPYLLLAEDESLLNYLLVSFSLIHALVVFILQIVFLAGMYNLRRLIYRNTVQNWQEQFSDNRRD